MISGLASLLLLMAWPGAGAVAGGASAPARTPAPPRAKQEEVHTVVGRIVSLDAKTGTLVVGESVQYTPGKKSDRDAVTVTVDASTKITRGRHPAVLSELRSTDHVVVRYALTEKGARAVSVRAADIAPESPATPPPATPGPTATPTPAKPAPRE